VTRTAEQSRLTDDDFRTLLSLRDGLRVFLHWSEMRAREAGLTPAQHQMLLVVRASDDPGGPTITDVAEHLLLRHHTVVELADRAEAAGLVKRHADGHDHRAVRLSLTALGRRRLEQLSELHVEELRRLTQRLRPVWEGLSNS
jgi:DNA-binding MarR family transcriptional regulator